MVSVKQKDRVPLNKLKHGDTFIWYSLANNHVGMVVEINGKKEYINLETGTIYFEEADENDNAFHLESDMMVKPLNMTIDIEGEKMKSTYEAFADCCFDRLCELFGEEYVLLFLIEKGFSKEFLIKLGFAVEDINKMM